MIKKISIVVAILFILVIIGFSIKTGKDPHDGMVKVESVPLHTPLGWGYDILVDHKVYIHQEFIPAIAGRKAFLSKEDAMKTAGLVIEKLVKRKPPGITASDLTALKIAYN